MVPTSPERLSSPSSAFDATFTGTTTRPSAYTSDRPSRGFDFGTGREDEENDGMADQAEQRVTPVLMRIAAVASLSGLLFGFDTGVVSGALLSLSQDPSPLPPLSTSQESFLVTSALISALASSLFAGRMADSDLLGRKGVIVVSAVLFLVGAAEMAAAQVYKEIILGRVLVGIGVGLASCVLPTYLAELSPPKFRGRIVASLVVLITGGQVLAYVVDAVALRLPSSWRWMFAFGIIPAAMQLVLSFSLPESPRCLLRKGKVARGRQVVRRLNPGWSGDRVQAEVEKLMAEVGTLHEPERLAEEEDGHDKWYRRWSFKIWALKEFEWKKKTSDLGAQRDRYKALVWDDGANCRTLVVACGLQLFQQATGFNCLMYYSTKVIQKTHLSSPATFALLIAISNFVCTVIALKLVDRTGRRKLLLGGLVGMIAGMIILSTSFIFIRDSQSGADSEDVGERKGGTMAAAVMSLIGMTGFCCAYALSLGNVPWIVQSEVFTPELKALGTGLATSVNWAGNIFVSSTFLHLSQGIGPSATFALFAIIGGLAWAFTYTLLPETKGLDLDEIRRLFERGQPGLASGRRADKVSRNEEGDDISGDGYHILGNTDEDVDEGEESPSMDVDSVGEADGRGQTRRKGTV